MKSSSRKLLLFTVFVLSGFSGLIYQSIWSQYLGLFLGHAAYAQAIVLSIFMGGMAAGAMWVAKAGERWRNLIRTYAIIEAVIGILGLLFHWIFSNFTQFAYDTMMPATANVAWLSDLLRWFWAAALIIPQTILLGMTFPLMSGGLIRRYPGQDGIVLGGLYFTNSIGAAAGALVSTFVLLPNFGLPGAMTCAGVLNLAVAALALWLTLGTNEPAPGPVTTTGAKTKDGEIPVGTGLLRLVLLSTALSGAASFVYEIVWIRMLSMAVGSTLHAFELMLASFIAGIAFGGLWVRKRANQTPNPLRLVGWMQVMMGMAALFSLVVYSFSFEWVGWLIGALDKTSSGYSLYTFGTAVIAMLVMFPAAFFAGTTLPLFTVTLLRNNFGERSIGRVYGWNTIGSIAGVLLAMHFLIPFTGLKLTLIVAALIDMGIGLYLLRGQAVERGDFVRVGIASMVVLLVTALSITRVDFDVQKLASGVFRTGVSALDPKTEKVVYYRDGKTATVALMLEEHSGSLGILTNGKPDAGIIMREGASPGFDEYTMVMLAALPLALHERPVEIGVIGFGSGMSTHVFLGDSRVERVDTIEIEPAMIEAARGFGHRVARAFEDPRSNIIVDDAKAYFSGQQAKYDIILSEPSNPWVSGIGGLFAKEFYEFVPRHLKPDGLFVQWIQLYEIDDQLVASVLNALTPAFSDYEAYLSNNGDMIVIAKLEGQLPPLVPERVLQGLLGDELVRLDIASSEQLQFRRIADARMLRAHGQLYGSTPNSYYFPILSLEAPRTRFMKVSAASLAGLDTREALLLEALGVRRPLSGEIIVPNIDAFRASSATRLARASAELLRGEDLRTSLDGLEGPPLVPAEMLHSLGKRFCAKPDDERVINDLATTLRDITDITLPFLTPEMQKGVLLQPAWLDCSESVMSSDMRRVMELLAALAERDWTAAHEAGQSWLEKPPAKNSIWKKSFDDVALSAILLDLARTRQWDALTEAERTLGKTVTSRRGYLTTGMLLLAMADVESRRSPQPQSTD